MSTTITVDAVIRKIRKTLDHGTGGLRGRVIPQACGHEIRLVGSDDHHRVLLTLWRSEFGQRFRDEHASYVHIRVTLPETPSRPTAPTSVTPSHQYDGAVCSMGECDCGGANLMCTVV